MSLLQVAPLLLDMVKGVSGAFFGAGAAFGANHLFKYQQRRRADKAAGNLAVFILSTHYNTIYLIQRELAPYRGNPPQMPPLAHVLAPPTLIDVKSLSFLIEAGDGQLLGEIRVAEDAFLGALDALQQRNKFHVDEVQPAFENAGFLHGKPVPWPEVVAALGARKIGLLMASSEHVLKLIDNASEKLLEAGQRLHDSIRREFPRAKIVIKFSPLE